MRKAGLIILIALTAVSFFCAANAQETKGNNIGKSESNRDVVNKPPAVKGFAGMAMFTTVWLKWEEYDEDVNGFKPAGYRIYRREEGGDYGEPAAVPGPVSMWTDYNLERGKKYYYKISAYDSRWNESEPTNELPVETQAKAQFRPFYGEITVRRAATLDVLCAIYHGGMEKEEAERVRNGLELARHFFWRNSRCRLNLNMMYLYIDEDAPVADGKSMKGIEEDLRRRGYVDNQFDAVFATGPAIKTRSDGLTILGNTAGAMGWAGLAKYPGDDPGIYYEIVWVFADAFSQSLDKIIVERSGWPRLFERNSSSFSGIAGAISSFDTYDKFKPPWDGYIEVLDRDDDGIPDMDERVPLDERQLPSDPRQKDTDNDYLDDMDEMTASIWWGSDCLKRDTDGDGLLDGKDKFPLVDFQPVIKKTTVAPAIDGKIEDTWEVMSKGYFWSNKEDRSVTTYVGWDEKNLYFAVESDKKWVIVLSVVENSEDGIKDGSEVHTFSVSWGNREVYYGSGKTRVEGALAAHWKGDDGTCQTEIKIPVSFGWKGPGDESEKRLPLKAGGTIALSIGLSSFEDKFEFIYVTDHDGFYDVKLEK